MTPVQFRGTNITFGEGQPQYKPLPAFMADDGTVVTCWRLTWRERLRLLFTGRIFIMTLTFKAPIQPMLPTLSNPLTSNPPTT